MDKKIIILFVLLGIFLVMAGPVFAKENVKVKISTEDSPFANKGYIVIKLTDSSGKPISSKGTINYTITDQYGNYKWVCKSYRGEIKVKYPVGSYKVYVKFDGDSKYNGVEKLQFITLQSGSFDPYNYYDENNWGLNQEIDDYFDYNYWDEEIYDDASNYDGEGY